MKNELTPSDAHALAIIMLEECFKYSAHQAVAFSDILINAVVSSASNNTYRSIIHRGIDGYYDYIDGNKDKVGENLLDIIRILENN